MCKERYHPIPNPTPPHFGHRRTTTIAGFIRTYMRWKAWKTAKSFHDPDHDWGITQRWGNSAIRWSWTSKSMKRTSFWLKQTCYPWQRLKMTDSTRIFLNLCRSSTTIDSFDAFQSSMTFPSQEVRTTGYCEWELRPSVPSNSCMQYIDHIDRNRSLRQYRNFVLRVALPWDFFNKRHFAESSDVLDESVRWLCDRIGRDNEWQRHYIRQSFKAYVKVKMSRIFKNIKIPK